MRKCLGREEWSENNFDQNQSGQMKIHLTCWSLLNNFVVTDKLFIFIGVPNAFHYQQSNNAIISIDYSHSLKHFRQNWRNKICGIELICNSTFIYTWSESVILTYQFKLTFLFPSRPNCREWYISNQKRFQFLFSRLVSLVVRTQIFYEVSNYDHLTGKMHFIVL